MDRMRINAAKQQKKYPDYPNILLFFLFLPFFLCATSSLPGLYSSLDPTSVSQHFAFYELYPETPEGRQALKHAWELLSEGRADGIPK